MDGLLKLEHKKYLRETVVPDAVQRFHALRKAFPDVDLYQLARNAGNTALMQHSPTLGIKDYREGQSLVRAYIAMTEAEFAVEIQLLAKKPETEPFEELVN